MTRDTCMPGTASVLGNAHEGDDHDRGSNCNGSHQLFMYYRNALLFTFKSPAPPARS